MRKLFKALVLCALSWAIVVPAFSQEELLKLDRSGRPILVMDEALHWSSPISVYSDSDLEMFVPDITTTGWIQWNARRYRQTGTYIVSVFSFYKSDYFCRKELIPAGHKTDPKWLESCSSLRYQRKLVTIDTRKRNATFLQTIVMEKDALYNPQNQKNMRSTVPLSKVVPRRAYDRISEIVGREINEYRGMTVEEVIQSDSKTVLNMMKGTMTPDQQQGCPNATPEQLQNWHNTGCPPAISPAPASH
jgi:hypothetical protein